MVSQDNVQIGLCVLVQGDNNVERVEVLDDLFKNKHYDGMEITCPCFSEEEILSLLYIQMGNEGLNTKHAKKLGDLYDNYSSSSYGPVRVMIDKEQYDDAIFALDNSKGIFYCKDC